MANAARRSRDSALVAPSTSTSMVARTMARQSITPSCSAAANARASGSIDFIAAPSRSRRNAICAVSALFFLLNRPNAKFDRDEKQRVQRRPNENYTEAQRPARRPGRQRARRRRRHQRISAKRESPPRPAGDDEPLVVVVAMRTPEALAAHDPAQEGERRIRDEGREDEQWKPQRPDAREGAIEAERPGEESQGHRPGIAEEHPRRGKVVRKKSDARRGQRRGNEGERHRAGLASGDRP